MWGKTSSGDKQRHPGKAQTSAQQAHSTPLPWSQGMGPLTHPGFRIAMICGTESRGASTEQLFQAGQSDIQYADKRANQEH